MHASYWYYSYRAISAVISTVCVAGSVLPSPTTGSCMQEGFFMSNELSVWICDIYTTGIFRFLPYGWLTRSEAFV